MTAFRAIMDHLVPGHWGAVRAPNDVELRQTLVVAVRLDEASAKVRVGPSEEEDEDQGSPTWAGVIPLTMVAGPGLPDADVPAGVVAPPSVARYARDFGAPEPQ